MEAPLELNSDAIDALVYEIIHGFEVAGNDRMPPLGREEIYQAVLAHMKENIAQYVLPSLQRLDQKGVINRDVSRGRPYRYWLPSKVT
jgi:hypothetical protein